MGSTKLLVFLCFRFKELLTYFGIVNFEIVVNSEKSIYPVKKIPALNLMILIVATLLKNNNKNNRAALFIFTLKVNLLVNLLVTLNMQFRVPVSSKKSLFQT